MVSQFPTNEDKYLFTLATAISFRNVYLYLCLFSIGCLTHIHCYVNIFSIFPLAFNCLRYFALIFKYVVKSISKPWFHLGHELTRLSWVSENSTLIILFFYTSRYLLRLESNFAYKVK